MIVAHSFDIIFSNILGDMVWAMSSGNPGARVQRRYVGHYVDNVRNGKGKMTYPNGDQYTGKEFKYLRLAVNEAKI